MALCNHFSKFKALNLALLQVDYSKKEKKNEDLSEICTVISLSLFKHEFDFVRVC